MPLLWLFLIIVSVLSQRIASGGGWARYVLPMMAAMTVLCGLYSELQMAARRSPQSMREAETDQVLKLYDVIAAQAALNGWTHPRIAMDRFEDYLHPQLIPALLYERHGTLFRAESVLGGTIFPVPEEDAIAAVRRCDFAILTVERNISASDEVGYPFDRSMRRVEAKLFETANLNLVLLERFHLSQQDLVLYMRPAVTVSGADDGWILDQGLTLSAETKVLRVRPRIELSGKAVFQLPAGVHHDIDLPRVSARWQNSTGSGKSIQAIIRKEGEDYRIVLSPNLADFPPDERSEITLSFDKSFSPRDLGLNGDTRRLVLSGSDGGFTPSTVEAEYLKPWLLPRRQGNRRRVP